MERKLIATEVEWDCRKCRSREPNSQFLEEAGRAICDHCGAAFDWNDVYYRVVGEVRETK